MLTIVKKNDSYDAITYQLENEDNSTVDLTGASVNFVMGKKNKLITNAKATVTSATSGIVSYQLTPSDTLVSGTFLAEFVVTFANGTMKTYPSNGYITVDVEQNLDTNQNNVVLDMIAAKQGDFEAKLNSILLQKGDINLSTMSEYTWTAMDGQLLFTFPTTSNYSTSSKWFQVYVGGIPVDDSLVNRSYTNQFALTTDSANIKAGMTVHATWVEPLAPVVPSSYKIIPQQDTPPTDAVEGELWFDTSDNTYQGTVFDDLNTRVTNNETSLAEIATVIRPTDPSALVQSKITANRKITFIAGNYTLSNITIPSNTSIHLDKNVNITLPTGLVANIFVLDGVNNVVIEGDGVLTGGTIKDSNNALVSIKNNSTNIIVRGISLQSSLEKGVRIANSTKILLDKLNVLGTYWGLMSQDSSNISIRNCTVDNNAIPEDYSIGGRGIQFVRTNYITALDNYVKDYSMGIECFDTCNNIVVSNNISETPFNFSFDKCKYVVCSNNISLNSSKVNYFQRAYELAGCETVELNNNISKVDTTVITDVTKAGTFISVYAGRSGSGLLAVVNKRITIKNNTCDNTRIGILFGDVIDGMLEGNTLNITDNTQIGINVYSDLNTQLNNIIISKNTVYNAIKAIFISGSILLKDLTISENSLYGYANYGIQCQSNVDASNLITSGTFTNFKIINNTLSGAGWAIFAQCQHVNIEGNSIIVTGNNTGIRVRSCNNTGLNATIITNNTIQTNIGSVSSSHAPIYVDNLYTNAYLYLSNNLLLDTGANTIYYVTANKLGTVKTNDYA